MVGVARETLVRTELKLDVGDANHLATMQQGAGNLPRPCYSGSIPSKDDPELPSTTR